MSMPHKTRVSQASQIKSSLHPEAYKSRLVSTFVLTNALLGSTERLVGKPEVTQKRGCGIPATRTCYVHSRRLV